MNDGSFLSTRRSVYDSVPPYRTIPSSFLSWFPVPTCIWIVSYFLPLSCLRLVYPRYVWKYVSFPPSSTRTESIIKRVSRNFSLSGGQSPARVSDTTPHPFQRFQRLFFSFGPSFKYIRMTIFFFLITRCDHINTGFLQFDRTRRHPVSTIIMSEHKLILICIVRTLLVRVNSVLFVFNRNYRRRDDGNTPWFEVEIGLTHRVGRVPLSRA